ncbi:glycosyl hydrolase family 76 [Botrytis cinerea]
MFPKPFSRSLLLAFSVSQSVSGITLDTSNPTSIKNAAGTVAHGLMKYYTGNVTNTPDTIAVLPAPYYWWEADSTYNDITTEALASQAGPLFDYMMPNHQKDEGNDDQAFWGMSTMSAAEKSFPEPSNTGGFTWAELTENLWNTQAARWDTSACGVVLNGRFSHSIMDTPRLARYTGNQTYVDWAEKVYDWTSKIGLIDSNFNTLDGADESKACTNPNKITWSYNNAIFLYGAAVMYNYTTDSTWQTRTEGLLKASSNFFTSGSIMYEQACEGVGTCNNDQFSFKAYLSRFMWATTQMAPFTKATITSYLTKSASAAASICVGDANACGTKWYTGSNDGVSGPGQQMSALEVIQGLLVSSAAPPIVKGQESVQSASSSPSSSSSAPPSSSSSSPPLSLAAHPLFLATFFYGILFPEVPSFTAQPSTLTSEEVKSSTAVPSSTLKSSSTISSSKSKLSTFAFATPAPTFDTTTTVSILHSTTVSCNTSVYANSTSWLASSSFLSSRLTIASSVPVAVTSALPASSKSSTALLIDTTTQPAPAISGTGSRGTMSLSTTASASAVKATVTAAAGRNMEVSGSGLLAGVLGLGIFWAV